MESDETPVKIKPLRADIVICLDVSTSMAGCLEQLKAHLATVVAEFERPPEPSDDEEPLSALYRVRLVPFRRGEDPGAPFIANDLPFCTSSAEFQQQLSDPRSDAEGPDGDVEPALDALLAAVTRSEWRPKEEALRLALLFTDAPPFPALHPATAGDGPDDVSEVLQVLKTSAVEAILLARRAPEFESIYAAVEKRAPAVVAQFPLFATEDEAHAFFAMDSQAARTRFAKGLDALIHYRLATRAEVDSDDEDDSVPDDAAVKSPPPSPRWFRLRAATGEEITIKASGGEEERRLDRSRAKALLDELADDDGNLFHLYLNKDGTPILEFRFADASGWTVRIPGSSHNGMLLNDVRLAEEQAVADGDRLVLFSEKQGDALPGLELTVVFPPVTWPGD